MFNVLERNSLFVMSVEKPTGDRFDPPASETEAITTRLSDPFALAVKNWFYFYNT